MFDQAVRQLRVEDRLGVRSDPVGQMYPQFVINFVKQEATTICDPHVFNIPCIWSYYFHVYSLVSWISERIIYVYIYW